MATAPSPPDPTYGLTLCVFVYCVGAQQLRRLLWSMGLPAGCVAFVARVADADVVLHQRAPRGTKQYQYDMVSSSWGAMLGLPGAGVRVGACR
jgi:hypothetical protein